MSNKQLLEGQNNNFFFSTVKILGEKKKKTRVKSFTTKYKLKPLHLKTNKKFQ